MQLDNALMKTEVAGDLFVIFFPAKYLMVIQGNEVNEFFNNNLETKSNNTKTKTTPSLGWLGKPF